MRDISGEDWLSCTIRMVEAVMAQHGFVDDRLEKQLPSPPAAHRERRQWIRFLVSLVGNQKLGVQFGSRTNP